MPPVSTISFFPLSNGFFKPMRLELLQNLNAFVYSGHVNRHLREEEERLNRQFPTVKLKDIQNVHDRFIIVDETVYHIGSSLNELGKKLTAFSVLNFVSKKQLLEMVSQASGKKNN